MPFPALTAFRSEFDNLFDRFFQGGRWLASHDGDGWSAQMLPHLNLAETDKEFEVTAELPGVEPGDISATLTDGRLTIKGEKKAEKDGKGRDWHRVERSYGGFQRAIDLPAPIAEDKILA